MKISNTNLAILITFLASFCSLAIGCSNNVTESRQNKNESLTANAQVKIKSELVDPVVELYLAYETKLNQPLKIHWKITNPNVTPIYIYTSLLQEKNSGSVEMKINKAIKTIDLHFTRLAKLNLEPNYFPKTEFTKIEAGKSLEGDFKSQLNLFEEIKRQNVSKEKLKAFIGEWNIKGLVAFGEEVDSIQKVIAESKGGHPVDAIVDWQKIATSASVKVILI
jgi:hypothetical protein